MMEDQPSVVAVENFQPDTTVEGTKESQPADKVEEANDCDSSPSTSNPESPQSVSLEHLDHITSDETIDRSSDTSNDQTNLKTSRELKSLLALSKEAKLDTNISHKRKSSDISKNKDTRDSPNKFNFQIDVDGLERRGIKRGNPDNKFTKFPVTAEAELESSIIPSGTEKSSLDVKRKKDNSLEVVEGASNDLTKKVNQCTSADDSQLKMRKDTFCWRCHRDSINISCETCPRSYHHRCLKQSIPDNEHWACPECVTILKAESTQTRSEAMKGMSLEHLCGLLKFALKRMIKCLDSQPFVNPVSETDFPDYKRYIVQPMYLSLIEKNIKENLYGSTQAFEADAKWILHNSIIFNSFQSKLTSVAKSMIKICKQEMAEIENCPSCYLNANTKKDTWFVEVCPKPHLLVWAKLKGFPYWPAKAMCTNSTGMVDVRFFGAHDRAWVPSKECYLYCRRDPNSHKQKKNDINECVKELEIYIDNLRKLYGEFHYAPFKMLFDPADELKQLQIFLPRYRPDYKIKGVKRYFSKPLNFDIDSSNSSPEPSSKDDGDDDVKKQSVVELVKPKPEDTDNAMEGYGTDDESILNPELNETSLRRFRHENSDAEDDAEDKIESEPEDDLPLKPSNLHSFDASPMRGKVRTRGGINTSTGKLKVIPRLLNRSEESVDDIFVESPIKMPRRNSDQSVKSDSSRLSNFSDKISHIDIPENMEVSLGNSKAGGLSISGVETNHSEVATEKSPHNDDNVDLEVKKKPVQVQIQNSELSLASQKKFKMSEHLIRRFTESEAKNAESTADGEVLDTDISSKPSETTASLSDERMSVEHETNNVDPIDRNDTHSAQEVINFKPVNNEKIINNDTISIDNQDAVNTHMETISNEVIDKDCKRELITRTANENLTIPPKTSVRSGSDLLDIANISAADTNTQTAHTSNSEALSPTEEISHTLPKSSTNKLQSEMQHTKDAQCNGKGTAESESCINIPASPRVIATVNNDVNSQVAVIEHIDDSDVSLEDSQIDEANIRNIIHSSLNDIPNITKPDTIESQHNSTDDTKQQNVKLSKRKSTNEGTIEGAPKKLKLVTNDSPSQKNAIQKDCNSVTRASVASSKGLIQTVLTDSFKINSSAQNVKVVDQLATKHLTTSTNNIESQEPMILDIKSEPESDSDIQGNESEYMEAKRQYMSALNISEKHGDGLKPKTAEIRTRSRTEEFRFKPLDNLSKIINEVATNMTAIKNSKDNSSGKKNDKTICIDDKQIYVKPLSQMQEPHRQRARKSFPKPNYSAPPKPVLIMKPQKNDSIQQSVLKKPTTIQTTSSEKQKPSESVNPSSNLILLAKPQTTVGSIALLPPNQTITYTLGAPVLAMVSQPTTTTTATLLTKPVLKHVNIKPQKGQNLSYSQNYIPQNESNGNNTPSPAETPAESTTNTATLISNLLTNPIVSSTNQTSESTDYHESTVPATSEEFSILNGILPDNICKEVSNLLARPPPKLKPRPPGPLSTSFEEGAPSSAGPVTAKINSIAHRLNDYFRGMIIELLEDVSKTENKEATISLLMAEIESLKHAHSVEISEIKKNICTTLKDIQKSIIDDRERIIDETRASCEAEAIKRIEEAKSKQWCANCSKEAQFYCCWNTSYCDYPCQQKHWVKHMNKCTQSLNSQQPPTTVRSGAPQYIIKQTTSKDARRIVGKPTKVYVNRSLVSKGLPVYHHKGTHGKQLTLVESTPGNYELQDVTPISVSGKVLSTSAMGKIKSTNVNSSPSTSSVTRSNSLVSRTSNIIQAKSPPSIIPARCITTLSDDSD